MCVGSNAAVMCLDYDSSEQFILGSSSDYATRVWGVQDHRLRVRYIKAIPVVIHTPFMKDFQIACNREKYPLSNFGIRHDVTSSRLHTSLRVTIKRACFAAISYITCTFHGISTEICKLPEVTSCLISKLDRVYVV